MAGIFYYFKYCFLKLGVLLSKSCESKGGNNIKTKLLNNKIFVALAALFCCALWGISTPIVKMGYAFTNASHVPSLLLWVGLQFAVSGFLTIAFNSILSKKIVYPKKENIKGVAVISLLQTVIQYSLIYIGLLHTTSVKGAILKSTDVFFVAIISSLIFKLEKLTVKKIISCIIGFLGIIIMNLNGLTLNINPLGDGLVLLAIVSYSFSLIVIQLFAQKEDPITLCGYQMTLGGIILSLIGIAFSGKIDFIGMLPIFICLSIIYSFSYTLWTILLKYNSASSITIYSFMMPVFGVISSAILLDEKGGVAITNLIIALILVCTGIIIWGYEKKPNKK